MKKIILIKLGGSVITDKTKKMTVRAEVLHRLVAEIAKSRGEIDQQLIVGHGQGSFAHIPAHKYQTIDGFINEQSRIGMAITQDYVARLNQIVVREFIKFSVPAVSFLLSSSMITNNKKATKWDSSVLVEYLNQGMLPITSGDVPVDKKQGCTIWSAERILGLIATNLPTSTQVERIIHVTETNGVLDKNGQTIKSITPESAADIKKHITATKGTDVTGGMWHKIEESLLLAEKGIESYIISGNIKHNLYQAIIGESWQGTRIHQE